MAVKTVEEYVESLRKLKPTAYMFGEKLENVVDNPRIRGGINATGATYELANSEKHRDLFTTVSPFTGERINRFTLPPQSIEDLVCRVKINRTLGNHVGTCHQRCTGLDCMSALSIVTYDIDKKFGTPYYGRFLEFLKHMQRNDFTANASVTDVKGDRSLGPHEQADKDLYLRIVEKQKDGIIVRGAKVHQTGSLSSHELIVLPTRAMGKGDEDYAVAFAVPADTKGIIHVVGRNTLDTREIEGVDCGNARYSKYCPTVIYDDVFVPWERVFMCGEIDFSGELVNRFSAFHRQSHGGCKSGKIDVMTGAALAMMDYNGSAKVTHLREKIVDMIYRAETLYGCSLAASYEGRKEPSGTYFINSVLANASKIHEGREMAEVIRLMVDIAGGYVADLPSDRDFQNPEISGLLKKYLKGTAEAPVDMIYRAETLYGCSLAASYEGRKEPSGTYFINSVLANASKIHEGREMAEVIRLMVDIAGGYVADLPSDRDFQNPEISGLLKKYLKGTAEAPVEHRVQMLRLVEKLALESADTVSDLHGGGSPQAHRLTIMRESDLNKRKNIAKRLAGIE